MVETRRWYNGTKFLPLCQITGKPPGGKSRECDRAAATRPDGTRRGEAS